MATATAKHRLTSSASRGPKRKDRDRTNRVPSKPTKCSGASTRSTSVPTGPSLRSRASHHSNSASPHPVRHTHNCAQKHHTSAKTSRRTLRHAKLISTALEPIMLPP